ncbi:(2Fe-2S)-binding protein [Gluconobacter frateurii]|uniref:(2Fe-2S)-binding protein n=1 Tax=Gluconobacter frateurii TaxID=38308 RepID=UPI001F05A2A7|nr:(2Fe-2S)-binding protein [Gluconobacter frateurii]UMM08123.1 (2Fe-2S)-binding protein [Gluconobacter frateurii]
MTLTHSRWKSCAPDKAPTVQVSIDGRKITAIAGIRVAALLLQNTSAESRRNHDGTPRAPYCMMGVCHECLAVIDGKTTERTCLIPVYNGMQITRCSGPFPLPDVP